MLVEVDEVVHMQLEGTMEELVKRLDPELYRKFIVKENAKPVLYVQLKKLCMVPSVQHFYFEAANIRT
jgi:hypothetical protein